MIKQTTQFKAVFEGIENNFYFDANCPIPLAKESLLQALKWVGQIEDQLKAQQESARTTTEENKIEEQKEAIDGEPTPEPEPCI
jgi:hypothetical protein